MGLEMLTGLFLSCIIVIQRFSNSTRADLKSVGKCSDLSVRFPVSFSSLKFSSVSSYLDYSHATLVPYSSSGFLNTKEKVILTTFTECEDLRDRNLGP